MKRARGALWLALGCLLLATSIAAMLGGRVVGRAELGFASIALFVAGGFGLWSSVAFWRRGLRSLQPSAEEALRDERAPVVYLRSFIDDDLQQASARATIGAQQFVPDPRAEECIVPLLGCLGPVIAIGRPGERLPGLGASRLYVEDDRWKDTVSGFLARARLVVILARTTTAGVCWEIERATSMLRPEQVVLFFPGHGATRERAYEEFRARCAERFPGGLPSELGNSSFVRFGPSWAPSPVTARSTMPIRALHESLLGTIQEIEPGFVEPPFWRIVPKPRLYLAAAILVIMLAAFAVLVGVAVAAMRA